MRLRWFIAAVAPLLAASSFALLQPDVRGEIENSHHDFGGANYDFQVCVPCHVPHNADLTVTEAPLWNHEHTTQSFTPYDSATLDSSPGQPSGLSKLCLSCHDGTVATDSYGGKTGVRTMHPYGKIGADLNAHHPFSFQYDASLATADGELADPSSASSGLGGTIAEDLLFDGRLECASCHDVHVKRNTQGCTGCHTFHGGDIVNRKGTLSLRIGNEDSALCLTCHVK